MELSQYYHWLKAAHIISFTAWMAGMLYLPRLFVYHADAVPGGELSETLKVMERRLLRIIINPAMILTFIFGVWMAVAADWFQYGWLHAKLLLVLILAGAHGYLARCRKRFATDTNRRGAGFYRKLNEVPTLLLIGIVILATVKPF